MYTRLENKLTKAEIKLSVNRKGKKIEVSSHYFKFDKRSQLIQNKFEVIYIGGLKEALDVFYQVKMKRIKQNFSIINERDLDNKIAEANTALRKNKKPVKHYNHVGIEIEFISPYTRKSLGQLIKGTKYQKYINLKEDPTINASFWGNSKQNKLKGFHPHEISLLVKEHELNVVEEILNFLKLEAFARVNKTCGLHVHLDMRHRIVEDSYKNLVDTQNWMYKINPDRINHKYCRKNRTYDFQTARDKYRDNDGYWNRFLAVNPHAYEKFKTLEVRVHKGSLDGDKIISWINFLIKVVDGKTEGSTERLPDLKKRFKLTKKQLEYLRQST